MSVDEKLTEQEKQMLIDLVDELSSDIDDLTHNIAAVKQQLLNQHERPQIEKTLQQILDINE